ncbi:MAG: hypothetical protein H8D87_11925 [Deltaproteobacteria bacterium]|uniref:hypothetical protein n=1 Tax=Desulfobacula sp. TaxID=2593537 RepID=UPI0019A74CEE|nr:hypothetical protein [Candidatus Desulfobacula maris]MBL6992395.1 hypothetical protein [Desulfobacula sp.]
MRKIIVFAAAWFMFTCSFLLIVPLAGAGSVNFVGQTDYGQAWIQTDRDNALVLSFDTLDPNSDYRFGLYDITGPVSDGNSLELLGANEYFRSFKVDVAPGGGFLATEFVFYPWVPSGSTLALATDKFGFYFFDGSIFNTDYTYTGGGTEYLLTWSNGVDVMLFASDVAPVPIPTAALLLGSGLVGLVGFRRRRQT